VGDSEDVRFACDAMCGGLARWLRALGYDASYEAGIDDAELVQRALAEGRILITSDGKLLERRLITTGRIRALRLPRGLKLLDQLEYVVHTLSLAVRDARCTACGGALTPARRDEVSHIVPARSLVWANQFFTCERCGKAFWDGTHWRRVSAVRRRFAERNMGSPKADP